MNTIERFIELKSKLTSSGLDQKETQELQRLSQVVTPEDEKNFREQQQQKQDLAHQAYLLTLYQRARNSRGQILRTCQANDAAISDTHMPTELFLEAVKRDGFARQFVWIDLP